MALRGEQGTALLDLRDDLAYRELRGESLSAREQVLLRVLNRLTRLAMPPRDPIPDDILPPTPRGDGSG